MIGLPWERLAKLGDPERVTARADEAPADAGGLADADVAAIWDATVACYRSGLYPAMALCVRRRGAVMIDRAIGFARGAAPHDAPGEPRVPATPRTKFGLFSASKMVTAMLVHWCDQQGLLRIDDPVAHYLPSFGRHGKHRMTIRHVLTHRAGIPRIPTRYADVGLLAHPTAVLDLLAEQPPQWRPGARLAYHALTGGFVLGAIVEAVTGKDLRAVLRDNVTGPIGLTGFDFGVPPDEVEAVAENAFTGPPVWPPLSTIIRRALSVDIDEVVRISNDPRFLTAVVPAGNIISTANETSRFMQLLLEGGALDGVRVFDERTLARATVEQTFDFDLTLAVPVRYSLGFMLGARQVSTFGRDTARAFGHLGFTNVFAWADPARELAVALLTSGKPVLSPRLTALVHLIDTISSRTKAAIRS
jgi:CubicO group peptidase (beta-lactamase class C family)